MAAPGRIPWTVVRDWCQHHEYGPDRMDFLDRCLMAMDTVFIEHWQAEQAEARRQREAERSTP
ncbi:hypothetical protein [Pseudoroseomonas cervicalis]|uniref:hypothetical protein n=1 Tax=Teichococcus cervicalis TaxID=204525 RepID=UPI0027D7B0EF|nr:hypothetical protein [Pseudoroseomonas cervicalis]